MSASLWILVTILIWGSVPILEKVGLATTDPTVGVFVRSGGVVAGALLVGLVANPWRAMVQTPWRSVLLLAGGGFLASFIGQITFYQALKAGEVSRVSPLVGAYPLVAALLGWWLLREPLTLPRVLGVLLIVGGVLLLK